MVHTHTHTWHVAEHGAVVYGRQGEGEGYVFQARALVPHGQLHQQGGRGGLQVEAALQHGGLRGHRLGGQVQDHEPLKLLQELLRQGAARALGLLPRALEAMQRLVHLHHLLVESGRCRKDACRSPAFTYRTMDI